MKRNTNITGMIMKGIELGIFTASVCFEGAIPIRDINIIQRYIIHNKLNIKEILDKRMPIVLW